MRVFWGAADGVLRAADPYTGRSCGRWRRGGGSVPRPPWPRQGRRGQRRRPRLLRGRRLRRSLWRHDTRGTGLFSGDFGFDRRTVQSSPAIARSRLHRRPGRLALRPRPGDRRGGCGRTTTKCPGSTAAPRCRTGGSSRARPTGAGSTRSTPPPAGALAGHDGQRGVDLSRGRRRERLLVGGRRVVRALDTADGSVRWQTTLPAPVTAPPRSTPASSSWGRRTGASTRCETAAAGRCGRPSSGTRRRRAPGGTPAVATWPPSSVGRATRPSTSPALSRWMEAGLASGDPGSVVFAQSWLPEGLREGGEASLFRRYLDAGGTVVWASLPPDVGAATRPRARPAGSTRWIGLGRSGSSASPSTGPSSTGRVPGARRRAGGSGCPSRGSRTGTCRPSPGWNLWPSTRTAGTRPSARVRGPARDGLRARLGKYGPEPEPRFLLAAEWRPAAR